MSLGTDEQSRLVDDYLRVVAPAAAGKDPIERLSVYERSRHAARAHLDGLRPALAPRARSEQLAALEAAITRVEMDSDANGDLARLLTEISAAVEDEHPARGR